MIEKKDIIKMAHQVFKRGQGVPDKRLLHPSREWLLGVVLAMVIVLIGGMLAARSFIFYWQVDGEVTGTSQSVPRYQQVLIDDVLEQYEIRAQQYDSTANSEPVIVPEVVASSTESTEAEESTVVEEPEVAPEEGEGELRFE